MTTLAASSSSTSIAAASAKSSPIASTIACWASLLSSGTSDCSPATSGSRRAQDDARAKNYVPRRENTKFSHAIDEYIGEYSHPAYGPIVIERGANEGDLKLTFHTMSTNAQHWHYDVWRSPHNPLDQLQETEIMFNTDWEGNIANLSCSMEPNVKDIVFTRQPDRRMSERSFLEPLPAPTRSRITRSSSRSVPTTSSPPRCRTRRSTCWNRCAATPSPSRTRMASPSISRRTPAAP